MLLFHSRRIGRSPARIALPGGDTELEQPDSTTILGAAKLTGRTGAWSYGALSALTSAEHARVSPPVPTEAGAATPAPWSRR